MFSNNLSFEQKQAIRLLSIGTFLECFDFFLYMHMAVLLNDLFFPSTGSYSQTLLTALNFSTAFLFRPIGALLFGYIGDQYGRKSTIIITTLMMAITCLVMTFVPTYAQIGMTAAWIVMVCRALQGISSMGEIVGAQLFLTELIPLPTRFPAVGLIHIFGTLGGLFAVCIAALSTAYGFNWRIAFMVGSCIAFVGSMARTALRETPEFADAKRRLNKVLKQAGTEKEFLENNPLYQETVNKKTAWAYLGIMCAGPAFIYFIYFYSPSILKSDFGYNVEEIIGYNLLIGIVELLGWALLRTYLSSKIYPLRILQAAWVVLFIFVPFLPWLLNNITSLWHLFLIQSMLVLLRVTEFPAAPIFFKHFPVFKRFSYTSVLYTISHALVYIVASFGMGFLVEYLGYWGLLIIMLPVLIGYGLGLNYFKNLEIAAGRYPQSSKKIVNQVSAI